MAVVAVFGMVMIANGVFADEAVEAANTATMEANELVTVSGTVSVQKDAKGEVAGIELIAADGAVYYVTQNAEGNMLAKDDGKHVEATGIVFEKEGKKWLHVKTCKATMEGK
jgi:hypothetical protein